MYLSDNILQGHMVEINQQTASGRPFRWKTPPLPGWADLLVPKIYAMVRNFLSSIGLYGESGLQFSCPR